MQMEILALRSLRSYNGEQTSGRAWNCRPLALGDPFAPVDSLAVGAGDRQTGNCDCVASKRVSIVLALEKQGREFGSTLRQPRNTGANPANK